jgi:predicted nucleic acid-binding protein
MSAGILSGMDRVRRIYLDVCCFNRPFDDQRMERVRMEAEAVKGILLRIRNGSCRGISSTVVDLELRRMQDAGRLVEVQLMTTEMEEKVEPDESDRKRAALLIGWGFKALDALHVACAERGRADVFLTTDDVLLRVAARTGKRGLRVRVANPLQWFEEVLTDENAHA